ncbi:MAG TPA: plastocyanin/azurin family copper-binding protein [Solirubrobacteraceae bacterium]
MHTLAVHLAPILAAEKSKAPFFIAGGLLVAWALFVSLALGLRNPDFPGNLGGQRIVSAITAVLVIAAASTAVITSGGEAEAGKPPTYTQFGANTPDTAAPESANSSSSAAGASTSTGATSSAPSPTPTPAPAKPTKSTPSKSAPAKTKTSPKATTGTPAPPSSPAATATTTLKLAANPAGQLAYDTKTLSAKAGKVTIDFANASPVEHDVAIAQGTAVAGQTPVFTGGSKTLTLNLKPGTYSFYCTVPGHRQAGMEGTLTVS